MKNIVKSILTALLTGALLLTGCANDTADETDTGETAVSTEETVPAETEPVEVETVIQPEEVVVADGIVAYEEFGAVGNGVQDDFAAIKAAHAFANEHGLPVKAKDDAVYYMAANSETIEIQTSTDWGTAQFILDDRNLEYPEAVLFNVTSGIPAYEIELAPPVKDQENLGVALEQDSMVLIIDNNIRRSKRTTGTGKGDRQQDILIVAKDGSVSADTPVMWDYEEIRSVTVYPLPEDTLYLTGGTFTTYFPLELPDVMYVQRALVINRSNTVVDGLTHYVKDGVRNVQYYGFLRINKCTNVIVQNSVFTGHKSAASSYDIIIEDAVNVSFINATQSNNINLSTYWGITGTNRCRNLLFDNCKLNRIDAHSGVANITIRNCEIGSNNLSLGGFGTMLVENTKVNASYFLHLRPDYGSSWNGDIIIRNCTWDRTFSDDKVLYIINAENAENHDFGYDCYLGRNITIDGLHIMNTEKNIEFHLFTDPNPGHKNENYEAEYPYHAPETVTVRGITADYISGNTFKLNYNPNKEIFKDTEFIIEN